MFRGEAWMLWMVVAMLTMSFQLTTSAEALPYAYYGSFSLYCFSIGMFMFKLRQRQDGRMAEIEMISMNFLRECRKSGRGKFHYFVPYTHTDRTKRWYAKLFKKTYLRVYETSFWDDGISGMNSYKKIAVNRKQLFEMKLRGMVNTESRERADEALVYLGIEWPLP